MRQLSAQPKKKCVEQAMNVPVCECMREFEWRSSAVCSFLIASLHIPAHTHTFLPEYPSDQPTAAAKVSRSGGESPPSILCIFEEDEEEEDCSQPTATAATVWPFIDSLCPRIQIIHSLSVREQPASPSIRVPHKHTLELDPAGQATLF